MEVKVIQGPEPELKTLRVTIDLPFVDPLPSQLDPEVIAKDWSRVDTGKTLTPDQSYIVIGLVNGFDRTLGTLDDGTRVKYKGMVQRWIWEQIEAAFNDQFAKPS